jgi:subtilisin family serine protease
MVAVVAAIAVLPTQATATARSTDGGKAAALAAGLGSGPAGLARERAEAGKVVKDSYIVVFKDGKMSRSAVTGRAGRLATRFGGKIGHTYTNALRGFEVRLTSAQAKLLAADPAVAYVEPNLTVSLADTQSPVPSWGLDRIDQRNLPLNNSYTYPTTASGVRVYVIDTGIRFTHTTFGGRAITGFDAIDGGSADDGHGHGTHVAGTVGGSQFGVAKGVTLVGVRVLNNTGNGTNAQVIAGIDWVTGDHDPGELAVANMSLGGTGSALNAAVANSIADGVTYAVAAGNNNGANACSFTPASTPAAITVGATGGTSGSSDTRASFSNIGTCLDIFAPGVAITSAWRTSDTATNTISGTSMATPHVAGAAAIVLAQNPSFTPLQIRNFLVSNGTTGVVGNPGTGSPNVLLFVVNDGGPPPVNDFSIAVSPTSGAVVAGGSVGATVSTATTNGSPQTVTFSTTGLPAGANATFNPASVTSGGSSAMTISTSASTPPGTYPVSVRGTAASGTKAVTFTLVVNSPGGCTGAGQKLGNPGFETGSAPWQADPNVIGAWAPSQPARTGTRSAWMVGYGFTTSDTLQQSVTLPAGCSTYSLSFWLHIDSAETTTVTQFDILRVQVIVGGSTTTLATWSNLNEAPGYVQRTVNMSAFAGQTVTLRFFATEDSSLQTSFVIDDTALTVA